MSLRASVVLYVLVIIMASLASIYEVEHHFILPAFASLELTEARKDMERCRAALLRESEHLMVTLLDWSAWDDTYSYVDTRNQAYRDANLKHATFDNAHLNLMYIFDTKGEVVWGEVWDLKTQTKLEFSDPPLPQLFQKYGLLQHTDPASFRSGIMMAEKGPMLIGSLPIVTSDNQGPIRGVFLMGRFLDEDLVRGLAGQVQVALDVWPIAGNSIPSSDREILNEISDFDPIQVRQGDNNCIFAYTTFPDLRGDPLLLFRSSIPRDISQQGLSATRTATLSLIVINLLALFFILRTLERKVLVPVSALNADIGRVTQSGESSARVGLHGTHELAQLCAGVNRMLEERERAQQSLRENEARYRGVVEDQTELICRFKPDGALTFVNQAFANFWAKSAEELIGANLGAILPKPLREATWERLATCTPESAVRFCVHEIARPDGNVRWLNCTHRAFFDPRGNVTEFQCVARDATAHLQAERALQESEERYRRIVETATEGIWVLDAEGRTKFANRRMAEMLGVPLDEMPARPIADFTGEDWQALVRANGAGPTPEPGNPRDVEFRRPDGSLRWVIVSANPSFDEQGRFTGAFAMVTDITDRKKAEEAWRKSRARYHLLFNEMLNAFSLNEILLDENGKPRDYRILEVNPAFEKLAGSPETDVVGKTGRERLPHVPPSWIDTFGEVALTGKPARFEGYCDDLGKHIEGTAFSPEKGRFAIIFNDVTERRKAEEGRQRLATAVEHAAEAIVITDPAGAIQYVNPAFERISGYARDEAIGQNPRFLKSGKHDESFYRRLWETIARGEVWTGRLTNRRKDGTLFEEQAAISPIRDAAGAIIGFVAVKRDITEQVKLEEQLRHAQKMEAVGLLAGGVAHDFNNLLQGIQGYTQMALLEINPQDRPYADLQQVMATAQRASTLIRQLLTFSRRQVMQPQNLDLNKVIGDLLKMLRRVIGEHIELDIVPGFDIRTIHADPGQIEQVLMNLCVNARDAMPEGGRITIETANVDLDKASCEANSWAKEGRYVVLSVSDNGLGMMPEVKERIFEPFFTTKEVGKGTGLGLATVYGIVKQHEGLIHVYSEPGQGATFKIYLPAVASAPRDSAEPKDQECVSGGTETILLAEDDDTVRNLAARILKDAGYRVLTARDGEDALRVFNQQAPQIDLALVDVVMPKISGRVVSERIRAIKPNTPVLFSSGYSLHVLGEGLILGKGTHLIQKPYNPSQLLHKVRELLDSLPVEVNT